MRTKLASHFGQSEESCVQVVAVSTQMTCLAANAAQTISGSSVLATTIGPAGPASARPGASCQDP